MVGKVVVVEPRVVPGQELFRLDGRTVWITGGAGALGLTLVEACLEYGADVVCTDIKAEPPAEEWDSLLTIASSLSLTLTYHTLDITSTTAIDAFASTLSSTIRASHPLRGLIACAGISERSPALTYPAPAFRHVIDTNINGTFLCAQAAARLMRQVPVVEEGQQQQQQDVAGRSIVIIASMSGSAVNQGVATAAYNASKSALLQIARSLAAEWGGNPLGEDAFGRNGATSDGAVRGGAGRHYEALPPIRVNTVSPGYIRTEATGPTLEAIPGIEEVWQRQSMLGRLAYTHEFRSPVLFLLGDGSSYVTGADVKVDGGTLAW